MRLLDSIENKIIADKNDKNCVLFRNCRGSIVNNDCHYDSRVLYTFVTNENLWAVIRYLTKIV